MPHIYPVVTDKLMCPCSCALLMFAGEGLDQADTALQAQRWGGPHRHPVLAPGYDRERDGLLPCILWAYPREFKSKYAHRFWHCTLALCPAIAACTAAGSDLLQLC